MQNGFQPREQERSPAPLRAAKARHTPSVCWPHVGISKAHHWRQWYRSRNLDETGCKNSEHSNRHGMRRLKRLASGTMGGAQEAKWCCICTISHPGLEVWQAENCSSVRPHASHAALCLASTGLPAERRQRSYGAAAACSCSACKRF
jgi:hypothetical protein